MTGWENWKAVAVCYHPFKDRYQPCAQVQKCGWCHEVRFVSEIGRAWMPVVKPSREVRPPT